MTTFSDAELQLIRKLKDSPAQTVFVMKKPCPQHSVCNPLPLFRIYRIDDVSFEAQWNDYHYEGVKQIFTFEGSVQPPA